MNEKLKEISSANSAAKRNITVQVNADLFKKVKAKAKKHKLSLRAIVEASFENFIDEAI